jgi:hypothetical protein
MIRFASRALRDTGRAMSEESTTPDLVELVAGAFEATIYPDADIEAGRTAAERLAESRE